MKLLSVVMIALCASVAFAEGDGLARPKWHTEILVPGLTVFRAEIDDPKTLRVSVVKVDLKTPGLRFTGTGRCSGYGQPLDESKTLYDRKEKKIEPSVRRTAFESTQDFFRRCGRAVDNGGRGLDMLVAFGSSDCSLPYSNGFACPSGLTISDGVVVSDVSRGRGAVLIVRKDGTADLVEKLSSKEYPAIVFARSGYKMIRRGGKDVVEKGGTCRGRLAAGLSADRRYLYIVTADTGDVTRATSDGASYHDLNILFDGLGVADAAAFSFGRNCDLVVMDRANPAGRVLNGYDGNPVRVPVNSGIYREDVKSAIEKRREDNPVEARFVNAPRLTFSACSSSEGAHRAKVLKGTVKVGFTTELPRVKRPILNVIALVDVNGIWRYYDVICSDPNVGYGALLKKEHTVAQHSKWQPEVDSAVLKTVTFGNPKQAFFTGYNIAEKSKLLVYRLEVWQDGKLIAEYDSDIKTVKKLGLPDDWYIKSRHHGKIVYKYPPEEKK